MIKKKRYWSIWHQFLVGDFAGENDDRRGW
jgi:hypothetical protein